MYIEACVKDDFLFNLALIIFKYSLRLVLTQDIIFCLNKCFTPHVSVVFDIHHLVLIRSDIDIILQCSFCNRSGEQGWFPF